MKIEIERNVLVPHRLAHLCLTWQGVMCFGEEKRELGVTELAQKLPSFHVNFRLEMSTYPELLALIFSARKLTFYCNISNRNFMRTYFLPNSVLIKTK